MMAREIGPFILISYGLQHGVTAHAASNRKVDIKSAGGIAKTQQVAAR